MADEVNETPSGEEKPGPQKESLPEIAAGMEKIAREKPEIFFKLFAQSEQFIGSALQPKLTEEQTSKLIEQKGIHDQRLFQLIDNEQKNDFQAAKSTQFHTTIYAGLIFILLLVILILYRSTPDFAEKIITAVASAGFGFLGGYGYCKSRSK